MICCILNVEGQIHGCERCCKVGHYTSQTDVKSLARNIPQGERLLDGFLLQISLVPSLLLLNEPTKSARMPSIISTSSSCSEVVSPVTARVLDDALTASGIGFKVCFAKSSSNCLVFHFAALSAPLASYLTRDVWKGRATVRDRTLEAFTERAEVLKDALKTLLERLARGAGA